VLKLKFNGDLATICIFKLILLPVATAMVKSDVLHLLRFTLIVRIAARSAIDVGYSHSCLELDVP